MVDTTQLNYLPEADEYPEGIVRIEDGWRPTGGAVDPANNGGIANWQAQLLARRTNWLKARISAVASSAVAGLLKIASQASAEAGTDNTTAMTPLRVKQAVTSLIGSIASSAGFAFSLGPIGYVKLPSWLSGVALEWGACTTTNGRVTVTFPLAFPVDCTMVTGSHFGAGGAIFMVDGSSLTKTGFGAIVTHEFGTVSASNWAGRWFAIGY